MAGNYWDTRMAVSLCQREVGGCDWYLYHINPRISSGLGLCCVIPVSYNIRLRSALLLKLTKNLKRRPGLKCSYGNHFRYLLF